MDKPALKEYAALVADRWRVMFIGLVVFLVGVGLDIGQTTGIILVQVPHQIGRILWVAALIVTGLVAPFQAFQKVRRERDELRAQMGAGTRDLPIVPQPTVTIHLEEEPQFGTSATEGFPRESSPTVRWLRVAAHIEISQRMVVESLELKLDGVPPIPGHIENPNEKGWWAAFYHYFQIPSQVNPGKQSAQLKIKAHDKWWGSKEFWVTVPRQ